MANFITAIDHLAVAAASLEAGVEYIRSELGVDIPPGGVHPHMGTHNHLMRLGDGLFCEVIAINPDGEPPQQPRWFGLDDPALRSSLEHSPRLLTWVANTSNLAEATANASMDYGVISELSRGDLRWLFSLPEDGRLLGSGMLPYLMQWCCDFHPSERMAERHCKLKSLTLKHPNCEWLLAQLASINATELVTVEALSAGSVPILEARIDTPSGEKSLSSRI